MAGVPGAVFFEFDPWELTGLDEPAEDMSDALSEIADYVKTEMLQYAGEGKSPVSGGGWKRTLSPEYKKLKEKISGSDFANLELTGEMLDALEARVVDGKIQVGVWAPDQVPKMYNHNVGDTLPQRQLIPEEGQTFKNPIIEGMKEIAQSFMPDESNN